MKKRTLTFTTEVSASVEEVWAFHSSVEALKLLTPPNRKVELIAEDFGVHAGAIHTIKVRQFGVPLVWVAKILTVNPPYGFEDIQVKGPFAFWHHRHKFETIPTGTRITDELEYAPPFGPLGEIADALFIRKDLESLFAFRHKVTRERLSQN